MSKVFLFQLPLALYHNIEQGNHETLLKKAAPTQRFITASLNNRKKEMPSSDSISFLGAESVSASFCFYSVICLFDIHHRKNDGNKDLDHKRDHQIHYGHHSDGGYRLGTCGSDIAAGL